MMLLDVKTQHGWHGLTAVIHDRHHFIPTVGIATPAKSAGASRTSTHCAVEISVPRRKLDGKRLPIRQQPRNAAPRAGWSARTSTLTKRFRRDLLGLRLSGPPRGNERPGEHFP